MKIQKSIGIPSKLKAGFTLIELLAVISIILILAAITVSGIGSFQKAQARKATATTIKFIETKMEEYKLDNGSYPIKDSNIPRFSGVATADGKEDSSQAIAVALSGRDTDGEIIDLDGLDGPDFTVYWADADPKNGKNVVDSKMRILDSYGQPFRYRAASVDKDGNKINEPTNPDFDLWSIGPDGLTNETSANDDKNKDDIRNF